MRRLSRNKGLALTALTAAVVACSAATSDAPDTILFSHHVHSEMGVDCDYCHAGVAEDVDREAEALPAMAGCADCHDVESAEECGTCHTNTDAPDTYDRPRPTHLVFSHQLHRERSGDCADCHGDAAHAVDVTPDNRLLPGHVECNTCHRDELDSGDCKLCHHRLDLYQRVPSGEIYSHEPGFFDRHGAKAAAGGEQTCAVCHDQAYCADCHARTMTQRPSLRFPERVDRSFMHQGDWMTRHSLEARTGDTSCMKCHGRSSCSSCHEQHGVGGRLGRRNPHPPSWMTPGAADSHSRAARRRINECAACHDQGPASNCLRCHSSGGVDPHPPGWTPPVPAAERTSHEMCRICHTR
jgi:hypothetical protein